MVALYPRQRLILPIAPVVGGGSGLLTALFFALIPMHLLESLATGSGIASVLPAAEPPLGITARLVMLLVAGGGVALIASLGLFLLFGSRRIAIGRRPQDETVDEDGLPVLRRADAHPDAPPRRPVRAIRDLGTPFLEVHAEPAERDLPTDLDQPLAAYDPLAIRAVPAEPMRPVKPLATLPRPQLIDPGERFETFELTPMARPAGKPEPEPKPDATATIHSLLDRLERGVTRRDQHTLITAPRGEDGLREALGTLRRLASGAV